MVFVLAFGVGYFYAWKYPASFAVLTGVLGVSALVVPEIYVPFASAAVLGMLACLLLAIMKSCANAAAPSMPPGRADSDQSPRPASKTVRLGDHTKAILLIAASVLFVRDARADESAQQSQPSASTDYRVFVPINNEKKPVGEKVYLPREFFNELYRRATAAQEKPQGWLLGSALYRGSLEREPDTGLLACQSIKAQFDLRVFGRMVQISIPFQPRKRPADSGQRTARRPADRGEMGARRHGFEF